MMRTTGNTNMHTIKTAGALILTALAMTACGPGPQRLDGAAAPDGVATTTAAPSPSPKPTPTKPSPSPSAPSPPAGPSRSSTAPVFLGPEGYGALKMGMTRAEAQETGLIKGYKTVDFGYTECGQATLRGTGGTVYFTPDQGLTNVFAAGGMRTPEGIRLGSTLKAVKAAYPDYINNVGGDDADSSLDVDLPGYLNYGIDMRDGEVIHLSLYHENQRCLE